jgi:hypothetical protein
MIVSIDMMVRAEKFTKYVCVRGGGAEKSYMYSLFKVLSQPFFRE